MAPDEPTIDPEGAQTTGEHYPGAIAASTPDKPAVVTIQTIQGDLTIERWAEICQTS